MARYYDMDELAAMIRAKADTLIEGKEAFFYVAKWLELLPTADVVPKSELVRLQSKIKRLKKYDEERDIALHARLIASAKNETASEIFGELEKKACHINRIMNQGEPVKWDMLPAVIIKRSDFEELKKKYIHNNPTTPPDIDVNH